MKEVPFSIPVSGVVRIDGDAVTIIVNRAETSVLLGPEVRLGGRIALESGKTMFDIILETAREIIQRKGFNRFSAPDLYSVALEKYPQLKRNSFVSRVVACTPNHASYKHYASRRDYFSQIGTGLYWLNKQYTADRTSEEER
ncbi:hypothetical protein KA005_40040, partial [bacterium]|nr:hypothetical protein [bacterium]